MGARYETVFGLNQIEFVTVSYQCSHFSASLVLIAGIEDSFAL